jgi:hypothetical protein
MQVTAPFFDVLGIRPADGRSFTDAEAESAEGCLAVLAHDTNGAETELQSPRAFWSERFPDHYAKGQPNRSGQFRAPALRRHVRDVL